MKREKMIAVMLLLLELVAVLGFLGIICWMTVHYIQVGEKQTQNGETEQWHQKEQGQLDAQGQQRQTEWQDEKCAETHTIRVRIMDDNYSSAYHSSVMVSSDDALSVTKTEADQNGEAGHPEASESSEMCEVYAPDTTYSVAAEDLNPGERIEIRTQSGNGLCISGLKRAEGAPVYEGTLSLYGSEQGIMVINELPLERYLTYVVSSEMPSYYPLEAQKAQAVCARTYAWNCMQNADADALFDLDDSVNYQVYNNYSSTEYSETAAAETTGEILPLDEVLYYSTSCMTENRTDLAENKAFRMYLEEEPAEDAEYGSPWVRWETMLTFDSILKHLNQTQYTHLETIEQIRIKERREDGQVQKLEIQGNGQTVLVEGEYQIRAVLSTEDTSVILRDGTEAAGMKLLPSAFFVFEEVSEDGFADDLETKIEDDCVDASEAAAVVLLGGGYGHGIGLSQYGAAEMAEEGLDYCDILRYYYEISDVVQLK